MRPGHGLLMVLFFAGFLAACAPAPQQDGSPSPDSSVASQIAADTVFVNPMFACPSPRIVEQDAGYLYPSKISPVDTNGAGVSVMERCR